MITDTKVVPGKFFPLKGCPQRSIAFIANADSFLPELEAYSTLFQSLGWRVRIFRNGINTSDLASFEIEWHLMGTDFTSKVPGRIKIHEYASLSTPPCARLKNWLKKTINTEPDARVFQNAFVAEEMDMWDKPFFFRDMGVSEAFFLPPNAPPVEKEFTFVYSGSMDRSRQIETLVKHFLKNFGSERLLLIGKIPARFKKYRCDRLVMEGPFLQEEVPNWLRKAEYGINYIPDLYPFNRQTATKMLEYCAVGLKAITTDYHWANAFEADCGGRFFRLRSDFSNFNKEQIEAFCLRYLK